MADLAETRKFCVQSLRKAAKKCGVPLVRDSASRAKVEEFAQAVLDSDGPGEEKTAAERWFWFSITIPRKYLKRWKLG